MPVGIRIRWRKITSWHKVVNGKHKTVQKTRSNITLIYRNMFATKCYVRPEHVTDYYQVGSLYLQRRRQCLPTFTECAVADIAGPTVTCVRADCVRTHRVRVTPARTLVTLVDI